MKTSRLVKILLGLACLGLMALVVWAQQPAPITDIGTLDKESADKAFKKPYSPYAGRHYPTRRLFGDTHLHTSESMDAGAFGCRLGPKDAYRFAKGEEVMASMGERVRLSRPLDFLVVTDHSDGLGFFPQLLAGDPKMLADPKGRKLVQHDPGRARAPTRPSRSSPASRRGRSPRRSPLCPARPPTATPGATSSRRPTRPTTPATSPPSSATSGPRTPAATTCTATSSSATTA